MSSTSWLYATLMGLLVIANLGLFRSWVRMRKLRRQNQRMGKIEHLQPRQASSPVLTERMMIQAEIELAARRANLNTLLILVLSAILIWQLAALLVRAQV